MLTTGVDAYCGVVVIAELLHDYGDVVQGLGRPVVGRRTLSSNKVCTTVFFVYAPPHIAASLRHSLDVLQQQQQQPSLSSSSSAQFGAAPFSSWTSSSTSSYSVPPAYASLVPLLPPSAQTSTSASSKFVPSVMSAQVLRRYAQLVDGEQCFRAMIEQARIGADATPDDNTLTPNCLQLGAAPCDNCRLRSSPAPAPLPPATRLSLLADSAPAWGSAVPLVTQQHVRFLHNYIDVFNGTTKVYCSTCNIRNAHTQVVVVGGGR